MMSLMFADAVGPTGKVIAYEALLSNAKVAQENARLNGLGNILVRPAGVGESKSSAVNVNSSNSVVVEVGAAQNDAGEAIQIVRLDDDLEPGTKVDFIKIDVEGHDLHALRGMSRALRQRPIIDLALHNFIFTGRAGTLSEILALLNRLEYSWELLGEICEKPVKHASRRR